MDIDTLRVLYPHYSDERLAIVAAIYAESTPLQARINALPDGFIRTTAQRSLSQALSLLASNIPDAGGG